MTMIYILLTMVAFSQNDSAPDTMTIKLKRLKAAHDEGLITDVEYSNAKNVLIEKLVDAPIREESYISVTTTIQDSAESNSASNNTIVIAPLKMSAGEITTVDLGSDVSIDLVWIPPGSFTMGSNSNEVDRDSCEGPTHNVTFDRGFWLGKTEVTQKQYKHLMGTDYSYFQTEGLDGPVDRVTWNDAMSFCEKLQTMLGDSFENGTVMLPTEAEWEYGCRAGTTSAFSGDIDDIAWHKDNSDKQSHVCATKAPNTWGLYDIHGNLWEWCLDTYQRDYTGAPTNGQAWSIGMNQLAVIRGGAWRVAPSRCRSATRNYFAKDYSNNYIGFRVAVHQNP